MCFITLSCTDWENSWLITMLELEKGYIKSNALNIFLTIDIQDPVDL
jgi:hypothetical protein